MPPRVMY